MIARSGDHHDHVAARALVLHPERPHFDDARVPRDGFILFP